MTLIFKVTVIVMMIFTVGVVNLKLLEAALAKIAHFKGCGFKISLEHDLDYQSIRTHLKLYCGSVKSKSVNFNS